MKSNEIMTSNDYVRFFNKVTVASDGCWNFKTLDKHGYGQFNVRHIILKAHRISWEF